MFAGDVKPAAAAVQSPLAAAVAEQLVLVAAAEQSELVAVAAQQLLVAEEQVPVAAVEQQVPAAVAVSADTLKPAAVVAGDDKPAVSAPPVLSVLNGHHQCLH